MDKRRWIRNGGVGALTLALLTGGAFGSVSAVLAAESATANVQAPSARKPADAAAEKKAVMRQANLALRALADRNFAALAEMAGPEGVRFSPYAYVVPESDRILTADELRGAWTDRSTYVWGSYDGSGRPIKLDFRGYYAKFLYNLPYTAPNRIGYDQVIRSGNVPNNLDEVYPQSKFVEFYVKGGRSGAKNVGGMDWGSLRFVFQPIDGAWKLVGIVGDRWTV